MGIDQVIEGILGLAFGVRVLDGRRNTILRVGYGLVAYDLLSRALQGTGGSEAPAVQVGRLADTNPGAKLEFKQHNARNIDERVAYVHQQMLKGVKDPGIYRRAREQISKKCGDGWCIKERDHVGEITAIFNDVKANVRYVWDPTTFDAFQTPQRTLFDLHTGDCDDMASLLGAMLMSVGYKVRSRVVQTKGFDTFNHIYLIAQLPEDKKWMALDATVSKPAGWEVPQGYVIKHLDYDVVTNGS